VPELCAECGAVIPAGGSCRDNFHALLALEWEVPGGAGQLTHFRAVSSYALQHPDSMGYTVDSIRWLRSSTRAALAGKASMGDLRESARRVGKAAGRITRRGEDPVPLWDVQGWSMNVGHVLAGGVDAYCRNVDRWADSVIGDLDAADSREQ